MFLRGSETVTALSRIHGGRRESGFLPACFQNGSCCLEDVQCFGVILEKTARVLCENVVIRLIEVTSFCVASRHPTWWFSLEREEAFYFFLISRFLLGPLVHFLILDLSLFPLNVSCVHCSVLQRGHKGLFFACMLTDSYCYDVSVPLLWRYPNKIGNQSPDVERMPSSQQN